MRTLTRILNKASTGCCCTILTIMVFCITRQIITRFISDAPSTVFDEFTQVLFIQTTLLDGIHTAGLKKHLVINSLAQKLPAASVLTLNSFIQIIITVSAVIFIIYGGDTVVEKAQHIG